MDHSQMVTAHLGADPQEIHLDGHFKRFGKNKVFWAVGSYFQVAGASHWIVSCGDWRDPSLKKTFFSFDENSSSKAFKSKAKQVLQRIDQTVSQEKSLAHQKCALVSEKIWSKDSDSHDHPYLEKKKIISFGAKIQEIGRARVGKSV